MSATASESCSPSSSDLCSATKVPGSSKAPSAFSANETVGSLVMFSTWLTYDASNSIRVVSWVSSPSRLEGVGPCLVASSAASSATVAGNRC